MVPKLYQHISFQCNKRVKFEVACSFSLLQYQMSITKHCTLEQLIEENMMEDSYIISLLAAMNEAVTDGEYWAERQQHVFNGKSKMEATYSNAHVTARLRALFHELKLYHVGSSTGAGPTFYAIGGDNSGYPEDRRQKFSSRFANICQVLRVNKRVVMDIVEGRGVQGFVSNPWVYHRRKASNNDCNIKKKGRLMVMIY